MNPGWNPGAFPANALPMNINYLNPEPWEAPLRSGTWTGADQTLGYMRYTRGGLKGMDVEGAEQHFPAEP